MNKLVVLAPVWLSILGTNAVAAHLTIKSSLNSSIEGSDNYFMQPSPTGPTFRWSNTLNLDFLARTPTTQYDFKGNYGYFKYLGSGARDTSLTSGTPAGASFSVKHNQRLTTYNFSASWSRHDLTSQLLTETGIATGRGYVDTYTIQGGLMRQLSPLDTVTWSATGSTVNYTSSTQSPYRDIKSSASWNHRVSTTTTLTNSLSVDWFSSEDATQDQRLFWTLTTGAQTQVTPRLSLNWAAGVDISHSYQGRPSAAVIPLSSSTSGAGTGIIGNIALSYKLLPETDLTLSAARSTTPTILGTLQQSTTVSLGLTRQVNHLSSISASTKFSENSLSGSTYNLISATIDYQRQLTKETQAHLSYTFQRRSSTGTTAQSSKILLALTRDVTLLP